MQPAAQAFFREQGAGPGVVCLHSNAASSSQWRGLMELLAPMFCVVAADSYGAGKSPAWPVDRTLMLQDEVDLLAPAFAAAGDSFVLVGHSYGGAIALRAAAMNPKRVRALALYEPTLFALVDAQHAPPNDTAGIKDAVARAGAALDRGDEDAAARHFIDFWMGEGAWAATAEVRKPPIAAAIRNVRDWAHALVNEPTPLARFAELDVPVLLMIGKRSPPSGPAPARVLRGALRHCEWVEFEELGHMGPLTQPEQVNGAIAAFLARL